MRCINVVGERVVDVERFRNIPAAALAARRLVGAQGQHPAALLFVPFGFDPVDGADHAAGVVVVVDRFALGLPAVKATEADP